MRSFFEILLFERFLKIQLNADNQKMKTFSEVCVFKKNFVVPLSNIKTSLMSVPVIQFTAQQSDFDNVLQAVKSWNGVISVATIPNAKHGVDGIVQLETVEARESAIAALEQLKYVTVVGVKPAQPNPNATSQVKKNRGKQNHVTDFFKFDSYNEQQKNPERKAQRVHKDPNAPAAESTQAPADHQPGHGRGRGQGRGRGNMRGRNQNSRGQANAAPFVPIPMIQGFVAVLDNVPFNTTNEQIAKCFSGAGQIFDINRYELMAMVYFDSQEAVQRAIVALNGKKIKDNVITVSSGGVVKVPLPYIHAQQQGFFFQQ